MKSKRALQGFTLVELMAVMAIIAILAGLILGISGLASFKSDEAKTKAQIEHIKNLLEEYRTENGVYPESKNNGTTDIDNYNEIFSEKMMNADETFFIETDELRDPWNTKYCYWRDDINHNGSRYVVYVWSCGPDGKTWGAEYRKNHKGTREHNKDNIGTFPGYEMDENFFKIYK